ncbi:transporter [Mesorhizobium sp.]|uniref:transporter n=1 Tax=Mesorhizobium sp. TaxID=1871066 RepID=UPI000FE658DB|nr:transporter [Mesorhizobium sp.]RWI94915.1 MAG: transporter [Mesorhizobium sp.]TIQ10258.1 MAG: transporter [Mesorhizobium sp.]TIR21319.1 MAG: transporter [Mesorhizobium sp.]
MKISAGNVLKGKVTEIVEGATTSHARIAIGGGVLDTLRSPTKRLPICDWASRAYEVIKASDVIVGTG